jgi:hypothetical protein
VDLDGATLTTEPIRVDVVDLTGRTVAILLNEDLAAGDHVCRWDASEQAAAVYDVRLRVGATSTVRRMLLLR